MTPRVVIIGAGFAGYNAARVLTRKHGRQVDVTIVNPTDFMLYQPLLPDVAAGIVDPRHAAVSLAATLPRARLLPGVATAVEIDRRAVHYTDPDGRARQVSYDRLVIGVGAVNKVLPIEGSADYSHGLKGIPEALYLRDHIIRQVELAAVAETEEERRARLTFVVVGAGYTGTETAAVGQLFTRSITRRHPHLKARWILVQYAGHLLPELGPYLQRAAERTLRERGVELRLNTSVAKEEAEGVLLTDGEFVAARTVVWTTGVRPDPVVESFGLPTTHGRIRTDEYLAVDGHPEIYAAGDVAAVPDLLNPGEPTPMTGQHAERQGAVAGRNVAASLGLRTAKPYKHHPLGFLVDLGGAKATADPLGIPMSGVLAKVVTRAYHLYAMPGNRVRVAVDWALDALLPRQVVRLGLVSEDAVPLDSADPELPRRAGR
ncbi:NAD(P)/FAD-dependent oxidoreductase [Nonomuraea sp. NPDC050556]|uniref:NAD(P)/FAD-dependent oxidoreductase n=1 Tax=Nonomuraea sp. NPDC050556 TaxID=3364369 RepID=UPI0037AFC85A